VHVFRANGAAIGFAQCLEDFPQAGRIRQGDERAGMESPPQIGFRKPIVGRLQLGDGGSFATLERIDLRPAIAEKAIGIDHLQYLDLLVIRRHRLRRRMQGAFLGALGKGRDDREMRHIRSGVISRAGEDRQLVEIIPPGRLHRSRIGEVGVIQFLEVRRVGAKQI
jgi:hypothetical protein